jgi:Ser/Thr protein kinase RdoA (MazF antagonist)
MSTVAGDELDGRLTRDKLHRVLAAICAEAEFDPSGAELIKFTNNAVFRLPKVPAVVRIAGSSAVRDRIDTVVQVAAWLAEQDIPAVRLWPDVSQPVTAASYPATIWQYVPPSGPQPTGDDLAALLLQFHKLSRPPFPMPRWSPFTEIRQRLAEPEGLHPDDQAFLVRRCDELETELASVQYVLPPGIIHGDPFLGNLIPGAEGSVLCDFDSTCIGPREWDLTPVAVGKLRFNYPHDDHSLVARRYGFDVTTWDGFPILRRIRELKLVTSVVPVLRSNPDIWDQWQHRLDTFKNGDAGAKWETYR